MECSDEDRTNLTNIFSGLDNFTLQILSKRSNFDPLRSSGRQSSEDGTSNRPENDENDGSIDNGPSEEAGSEEDPGEERSTAQEDISRSVRHFKFCDFYLFLIANIAYVQHIDL